MSTGILDQVRAFGILQDFLPDDTKREIAEAFGAWLLAEITPSKTSEPRVVAETLPDPERLVFDEQAQWLADHGYSSGDQVRAAGRLEDFLKRHPNLTREAGRIVWLGQDVGMSR